MAKAVFIGVDLQQDFIEKPPFPIFRTSEVLDTSLRLVRHAVSRKIPLILTQDTHEEDDPCFRCLPPHNIIGTSGHRLVTGLEFINSENVKIIPDKPQPDEDYSPYSVFIVHSPDHRRGFLGNINADKVLKTINAEEHVVFGLPFLTGIRPAALGLCMNKRKTIIVSDGIGYADKELFNSGIAALAGAGSSFLKADTIIEFTEKE